MYRWAQRDIYLCAPRALLLHNGYKSIWVYFASIKDAPISLYSVKGQLFYFIGLRFDPHSYTVWVNNVLHNASYLVLSLSLFFKWMKIIVNEDMACGTSVDWQWVLTCCLTWRCTTKFKLLGLNNLWSNTNKYESERIIILYFYSFTKLNSQQLLWIM